MSWSGKHLAENRQNLACVGLLVCSATRRLANQQTSYIVETSVMTMTIATVRLALSAEAMQNPCPTHTEPVSHVTSGGRIAVLCSIEFFLIELRIASDGPISHPVHCNSKTSRRSWHAGLRCIRSLRSTARCCVSVRRLQHWVQRPVGKLDWGWMVQVSGRMQQSSFPNRSGMKYLPFHKLGVDIGCRRIQVRRCAASQMSSRLSLDPIYRLTT